MFKLKFPLLILIGVFFCVLMSSCLTEEDEPGTSDGNQHGKHRVILLYAVAANNLETYLPMDLQEVLDVAPELNLTNNKFLLYYVDKTGRCYLKELAKNERGIFEFSLVREFPELPLSTTEERISSVCEYVKKNYDYPKYGLILWSHATGWLPAPNGEGPEDNSKQKAFGSDKYNNIAYQTNITTLAEAIPAGMFDFIWFDCCYMANIETVYQLRDKTDYIIGYVTEIYSTGMPYDLTMPYLLKKTPDLEKAALELYESYNLWGRAVSVSIMDTAKLENLAWAAKEIFRIGTPPSSLHDIQNYGTKIDGKNVYFYDLKQLLDSYSGITRNDREELHQALQKAVIFKRISSRDFNSPSQPVNVDDYSGLSVHHYLDSDTDAEKFYRTLDWYKATR